MNKKDAIKQLWRECFNDSDAYLDTYFNTVYSDSEALLVEQDGQPISTLLLQPYAMTFHGVEAPVGYICGAATTRSRRGKGYMSGLVSQALNQAYDQGYLFVALIPAHRWLYGYYSRFQFSPAFQVNIERYTSAHTFHFDDPNSDTLFTTLSDPDEQLVEHFFQAQMHARPCCIQHSPKQYRQILIDNAADSGSTAIIADCLGQIQAMAFAVPGDCITKVKDIFATSPKARQAALAAVHRQYPDTPTLVMGYYDTPPGTLQPRGMIRLVNPYKALSIIAQAHPKLRLTINLHDNIIAQNDNVSFTIADGQCTYHSTPLPKSDYDISTQILSSIIFGNETTHKILNFPTQRPFISLMLD